MAPSDGHMKKEKRKCRWEARATLGRMTLALLLPRLVPPQILTSQSLNVSEQIEPTSWQGKSPGLARHTSYGTNVCDVCSFTYNIYQSWDHRHALPCESKTKFPHNKLFMVNLKVKSLNTISFHVVETHSYFYQTPSTLFLYLKQVPYSILASKTGSRCRART